MATLTLHLMHTSMQFSDNTKQKQADAQKIMARARKRNVAWVTGTEAGEGKSADLRKALERECKATDYRLHVQSDCWIALNMDIYGAKSYDKGFIQVAPGDAGVHSAMGITWITFEHTRLGVISVGASHYMTHGRDPGDPYYAVNSKLTRAIGEWGQVHGQGPKLAFYGADTNIPDRDKDVFRGKPFTTLADELRDWQNTGHGSIDVIASYDADHRVKGKYWRALDDREFFLNTDHYACEGGYEVRTLS